MITTSMGATRDDQLVLIGTDDVNSSPKPATAVAVLGRGDLA
ncbi:hypothetical protein [Micromonospora sp. NBC_01638]|nr:hypothetical protein OG811_25545 [Micromonospora sp. NBC_01638]